MKGWIGRRPWFVGLLAMVAFFCLAGAWALALPVNGTYDENQHIVRAYAVVTGQLLPNGNATDAAGLPAEAFDAPASLLPENANCTWMPKPPKPASCQVEVTDSSDTAMPSQAARYIPVYYALVGWPLLLSPDETGVIASRLLSALLSAALLGLATAIACRMGNRLLVAAIVLVCTPLVMNLAGAVNPDGLEITSGVLLFVSLLSLVRARERPTGRVEGWLLAAAGLAAILLLTAKQQAGLIMFAGVVATCLLVARRQRLGELFRSRRAWRLVGGPTVVGVVFSLWWLVYSAVTDVEQLPGHGLPYTTWEIVRRLPGERLRFYIDQVVARFGYGETGVSEIMIIAWYALIAIFVIPALWRGGQRLRIGIIGVVAVCFAALVEREIHFVPTYGWYSHSRYVMSLGVGCVLLAAFSDRWTTWLRDRGWLGTPVTALMAATIPLDIYALVRVMTRYQVGIESSVNPLGGSWHPACGSATVLVVAAFGLLGIVSLAIVTVPRVTGGGRSD